MSSRADELKEVRVLNRSLRWTAEGIEYEADPRHAEMLARALSLETCKPVVTPGVKLPFDNSAPTDDDTVDEPEDTVMSPIMRRRRLIKFNDSVDVQWVPDQQTTYGRHPRTFDFSADGRMMRR